MHPVDPAEDRIDGRKQTKHTPEVSVNIVTSSNSVASRWILSTLFVLGIALLFGMWAVLYWSESLFTESHLVGYYCCVTEQDLPAPGTLPRVMSDFFRTSPGKHLPSLAFVATNVIFFAVSLRRAPTKKRWWLPFLFIASNMLYLLIDLWLVSLSWSISSHLMGPLTSAYKGYHRTRYGIVSHLLLWLGAFVVLSRVPMKLKSESEAVDDLQV